jgi:NAD(P)H-hydrate epimerase
LAVPRGIADGVIPYLLESTLFPMPDDGAGHTVFDSCALDAFLRGKRAVAIGMGWGASQENQRILEYALEHYDGALVIDADGLNALSKLDRSILQSTGAKVILTPHLKEFERISGFSMAEIVQDPVQYAREYAKENGVCLLLKGACTVITDGEICYLVDRGCAGMATAGSGDVLSGILAGLLGYSPANALTVACGAYLAGLAGELAEAESNPISMTASDTVGKIPESVSRILEAIRA